MRLGRPVSPSQVHCALSSQTLNSLTLCAAADFIQVPHVLHQMNINWSYCMNKMNSLISGIVVFVFELSLCNSVSNIVTIPKKKLWKERLGKAWVIQSSLSCHKVLCAVSPYINLLSCILNSFSFICHHDFFKRVVQNFILWPVYTHLFSCQHCSSVKTAFLPPCCPLLLSCSFSHPHQQIHREQSQLFPAIFQLAKHAKLPDSFQNLSNLFLLVLLTDAACTSSARNFHLAYECPRLYTHERGFLLIKIKYFGFVGQVLEQVAQGSG